MGKWGGVSLPHPTMESGVTYASGVRGKAPAENGFWCTSKL